MRRLLSLFLLSAAASLAACSEDDPPADNADAGPGDALFDDVRMGDAGDASRPDFGSLDTGPPDGAIIEGLQRIEDVDMYVRLEGTLTSTLPPVFILHSGPGIAHEYLSPQM